MTKLNIVDAPLSAFEEARQQITEWEKEFPDTGRLGLVLDAPDDIVITITGPAQKISMNAGLFFKAAHDGKYIVSVSIPDEASFPEFVDAVKAFALALGYAASTVNEYFE